MTHPVPALGAALVAASGCVWWLPALATVRAGADRPDSLRGRAAACLSGWTTVAGVAVLLLVADPWWAPGALAVVGAATTAGLRIRAAVRRGSEARETRRARAALATRPTRSAVSTQPIQPPQPTQQPHSAHPVDVGHVDRVDSSPWLTARARMHRARNRFVTVLGVGLGVAVASALLPLAARPGHGGAGPGAAPPGPRPPNGRGAGWGRGGWVGVV
ncbi:hypothetical protein, partial [Streptomyces heilongjiangensis]|uniref:hypothetical protein n=1 Tax=Streptomyces heilongjiangensis TaxID=945052 RepID=UPI00232B4020